MSARGVAGAAASAGKGAGAAAAGKATATPKKSSKPVKTALLANPNADEDLVEEGQVQETQGQEGQVEDEHLLDEQVGEEQEALQEEEVHEDQEEVDLTGQEGSGEVDIPEEQFRYAGIVTRKELKDYSVEAGRVAEAGAPTGKFDREKVKSYLEAIGFDQLVWPDNLFEKYSSCLTTKVAQQLAQLTSPNPISHYIQQVRASKTGIRF